ncbi:MAG: hypothetical protein ACI9MF_002597, partial [Gammaproteobacteria bacterium]
MLVVKKVLIWMIFARQISSLTDYDYLINLSGQLCLTSY